MSAGPPQTIGKYQIIREIARSNDIVYEAYDPLMDRRVAVKELNIPPGSTAAQIQDRIDRFEREARAAGRLAHPNIMTVYDVGSEGDRHYMAMEFLDGHTLRNELDTQGLLPPDRALEIAQEVLAGLEHAHANGVVHRDIKPENIQILSTGQIKITDFGIARLTFQPNLTVAGQVFGTPSYMSPEQVRGGDIDARSDLFSVGILLYEMLAGEKPFGGDSVIAITHAILNSEPQQPRACNFGLWQVITRALDKSPSLRYTSAKEMSQALESHSRADVIATPAFQPYVPPPPVLQAPPTYSYNPYQAPTGAPPNPYGYSAPTGAPTGYTPPPNPVYYPPPPRPPLLNPEQKAAVMKFFTITGVVGAFLLMVTLALVHFLNAQPTTP